MIWLYQVRFAKGGGLVCIELLDRPVADAHVLIYKSRYQSRRGWIRQRGARFGGRHLGDVSTHLRMFRVVEDTRVRKEVIEHRKWKIRKCCSSGASRGNAIAGQGLRDQLPLPIGETCPECRYCNIVECVEVSEISVREGSVLNEYIITSFWR
jgi:hypothetical protein